MVEDVPLTRPGKVSDVMIRLENIFAIIISRGLLPNGHIPSLRLEVVSGLCSHGV